MDCIIQPSILDCMFYSCFQNVFIVGWKLTCLPTRLALVFFASLADMHVVVFLKCTSFVVTATEFLFNLINLTL